MRNNLQILVTNDDGYQAKGIQTLARIMQRFGNVTVVAPKVHQSGMSLAVSMGCKAIAAKALGEREGADWYYVDATPSSCVKFGIDNILANARPDVVVCGINHGSNAATGANYSGTIGAAEEAAINRIPGIGVSLTSMYPDADFSAVEAFFPDLFEKLMRNLPERFGIFYNINFPNLPVSRIQGIRVGHQGIGHWEREFQPWDLSFFTRMGIKPEDYGQTSNPTREEGESLFMMVGDFVDDSPASDRFADHHLIEDGYISIVPHNLDFTDYREIERLQPLFNK